MTTKIERVHLRGRKWIELSLGARTQIPSGDMLNTL